MMNGLVSTSNTYQDFDAASSDSEASSDVIITHVTAETITNRLQLADEAQYARGAAAMQ